MYISVLYFLTVTKDQINISISCAILSVYFINCLRPVACSIHFINFVLGSLGLR